MAKVQSGVKERRFKKSSIIEKGTFLDGLRRDEVDQRFGLNQLQSENLGKTFGVPAPSADNVVTLSSINALIPGTFL